MSEREKNSINNIPKCSINLYDYIISKTIRTIYNTKLSSITPEDSLAVIQYNAGMAKVLDELSKCVPPNELRSIQISDLSG